MHPAAWRFALFYFAYYAALGAYTPYVGRFVDALGHGGFVVGGMLVLWYASRVLGPPLWNRLLLRTGRHGLVFVAGCAATFASFSVFTATEAAWTLLAVMAVFGLFYNALMPQFEAMTLASLGAAPQGYGRIRAWGSVGFLLVAGCGGALLDRFGSAAFPWLALPLFGLLLAAGWLHRHDPPAPAAAAAPVGDAGHLWKRPGVRRFLLVALLMQAGFGPFYVFFTLHLQGAGHAGATVGALWAAGVLAEILLFWHAPRLVARFGAAALMEIAMAVTVLRWVATALWPQSLPLMLLAQASHALGFALFHACCMRLMADWFPGPRAVAGQGLLYGFSSGGGGVIGAVLAAIAWERAGGAAAFLVGAVATAAALVVFLARARPARA